MLTSPARRCLQPHGDIDAGLRPWDLGAWTGRQLTELDPDDLLAWRTDPAFDGHGGESLDAVHARVASLLERWHGEDGRVVAVTHATVVKAAVVCALRAPVPAVWDIDVHPGSATELHATSTGWRVVRMNDRGTGR